MDGRELRGQAAITGLGMSEMGRVYTRDARDFAAEAVKRAVEDAGLRKDQIDGLLVNPGVTSLGAMGGVGLQNDLGLANLRLLSSMNVGGATANVMVQYAAMSVIHGLANHVVCVFADAPLRKSGSGGGAAYAGMGRRCGRRDGRAVHDVRCLRRQRALRARHAPPHGDVRHDERPARRDRRRRARSGRRRIRSPSTASR